MTPADLVQWREKTGEFAAAKKELIRKASPLLHTDNPSPELLLLADALALLARPEKETR